MANFAEAQLLKYGWREGKGLGKNEDGIVKPLRPTLKFNTTGLGHRELAAYKWWANPFEHCSDMKTVMRDDRAHVFTPVNNKDEAASGNSNKSAEAQPKYKNFLRTATLKDGTMVSEDLIEPEVADEPSPASGCDDALFKAYHSNMKHHSTRYDPELSGKLQRIAMQDKILLDANTNNMFQLNTDPAKESIVTKMNITAESYVEKNAYRKDIDRNALWLPLVAANYSRRRMKGQQPDKSTIEEIKKESECRFPYFPRLSCEMKRRERKGRKHSKSSTNNLNDKASNKFCPSFVIPSDCLNTASEPRPRQETKKFEHHKTVQKKNPDVCDEEKDPNAIVIDVELDDMTLPQLKRSKELRNEVAYQSTFLKRQFYEEMDKKDTQEEMCSHYDKYYLEDKTFSFNKKYYQDKLRDFVDPYAMVKDKHDLKEKRSIERRKRYAERLNRKIQKKKEHNRKKMSMRQVEVMVGALKIGSLTCKNDLNDLVQGINAVNLAKDVSAEMKKKRTQTHHTPV